MKTTTKPDGSVQATADGVTLDYLRGAVGCPEPFWSATKVDADTKNDRIRATFVPIVSADVLESCQEAASRLVKSRPRLPKPRKLKGDEYLWEFALRDVHLGKANNWWTKTLDDQVAELRQLLADFIEETETHNKPPAKVYFPFGNDFFHYDNVSKTTANGTPQDANSTPEQMSAAGCAFLADAIHSLAAVAEVEVAYVECNHAPSATLHAFCGLMQAFRGINQVAFTLPEEGYARTEWGGCLLFNAHGHHMSDKQFGNRILREVTKLEGAYHTIEGLRGHLHTETVDFSQGVRVGGTRGVSEADRWHTRKGYDSSRRAMDCGIWCKEKGRVGTVNLYV